MQEAVPGFREAYAKFIERVTIDQNSPSLIINYGRNLVRFALSVHVENRKVDTHTFFSGTRSAGFHQKLFTIEVE